MSTSSLKLSVDKLFLLPSSRVRICPKARSASTLLAGVLACHLPIFDRVSVKRQCCITFSLPQKTPMGRSFSDPSRVPHFSQYFCHSTGSWAVASSSSGQCPKNLRTSSGVHCRSSSGLGMGTGGNLGWKRSKDLNFISDPSGPARYLSYCSTASSEASLMRSWYLSRSCKWRRESMGKFGGGGKR